MSEPGVPAAENHEELAGEAATAGELAHDNIQRFLRFQALEQQGLKMIAHQEAAAAAAETAGLAARIAALKTRRRAETAEG